MTIVLIVPQVEWAYLAAPALCRWGFAETRAHFFTTHFIHG